MGIQKGQALPLNPSHFLEARTRLNIAMERPVRLIGEDEIGIIWSA